MKLMPENVLPGYDHINRYYDRRRKRPAAKLLPGELYVTTTNEMIVTVLGSCVAACIRDKHLGIGGMNHFMLPEESAYTEIDFTHPSAATRYGTYAMERLINEILKLGGRRDNLEVKLVGGANVLPTGSIGTRNVEFIRRFVEIEGLPLAGERLGGKQPVKVAYFPMQGEVQFKRLQSIHNDTLFNREKGYLKQVNRYSDSDDDVEFFT